MCAMKRCPEESQWAAWVGELLLNSHSWELTVSFFASVHLKLEVELKKEVKVIGCLLVGTAKKYLEDVLA